MAVRWCCARIGGEPVIRAVLFDLDGTLFDRDATVATVLASQVQQFSALIPPSRANRFIGRVLELDDHGHRDKREVYSVVASEFGFDSTAVEHLLASFGSQYPLHCALDVSVARTLAELRQRGMALAIVTNGATAVQNAAIDALGIRDAVDAILISEAEGVRKPQPEIFHRAAARLGVAPGDCCFVGDHPVVDVEGATAAGLWALWKRTSYWRPRLPVPAIDAVSDVLNLDALLTSHASRLARFLSALTAWAATRTQIQGVALVGSHARRTATDTSDVDLIILADDPQAFLRERSWVKSFGNVVAQNIEDYGNVLSLRVYYEEGLEVEFGFADPGWAAMPLDAGTREVIAGGIDVLVDRGAVLGAVKPSNT